MTERIIIDQTNRNELIKIENQLAPIYKEAFAGPPWNERSKCVDDACDTDYSSSCPGELCVACESVLEDAYAKDELIEKWRAVVDENGLIVVKMDNDSPQSITMARPTMQAELYERKYSDVPEMNQWLSQNLTDRFVWIEDTFADMKRQPSGNLKDRGQVLAVIALQYSGLQIATRTLAPAIVSATGRDVGMFAQIYVGSDGVDGPRGDMYKNISTVPDRRTVLTVDGSALL